MISEAQASGGAGLALLGRTLDGERLEALCYPAGAEKRLCARGRGGGGRSGRLSIWFTCRQHPSETQASFFAEGVSHELLRAAPGGAAAALLAAADVFLVPNANPDGSRRGHTRGNAAGVDLNREWGGKASEARSPEVLWLQRAMRRAGAAAHLDVHGEEALPHAFSAPGLPARRRPPAGGPLRAAFDAALARESGGAYQTHRGYPDAGKLDARVAATWSSLELGAMGLTLEMPFRDSAERPDPSGGWTAELSRELGAAAVRALGRVVPLLRAAGRRPPAEQAG